MNPRLSDRTSSWLLAAAGMFAALTAPAALASDTPDPTFVTVAGSLQSELGCPGDWQTDCGTTHLAYSAEDGVWQGTFNLPAGSYEYKAALNHSWDENYGANAGRNGSIIPLTLASAKTVKFYYDHESHWITDSVNSRIVTFPGSYQSEIGCPGDWQPECLRSWLKDPDGDGIYTLTVSLPAGSYESKAAINESWNENYGAGGALNGANIPFTVVGRSTPVTFLFRSATNMPEVHAGSSGIPGDANADSVVNTADAVAMLRAWGGLSSAIDPWMGDVAPEPATDPDGLGDGRITILDAVRLLRHLANPEAAWP